MLYDLQLHRYEFTVMKLLISHRAVINKWDMQIIIKFVLISFVYTMSELCPCLKSPLYNSWQLSFHLLYTVWPSLSLIPRQGHSVSDYENNGVNVFIIMHEIVVIIIFGQLRPEHWQVGCSLGKEGQPLQLQGFHTSVYCIFFLPWVGAHKMNSEWN